MNKVEYYLDIAKTIAEASKCARRKFGALIVKDDAIIATGYNGSVRGAKNCGEDVPCLKDLYNEAHYMSYNYCPAVHAEKNAILNAARVGAKVFGTTLYLSTSTGDNGDRPCYLCRRVMINAGIKDCYYIDKDGNVIHELVSNWINLENLWIEKLLEGRRKRKR